MRRNVSSCVRRETYRVERSENAHTRLLECKAIVVNEDVASRLALEHIVNFGLGRCCARKRLRIGQGAVEHRTAFVRVRRRTPMHKAVPRGFVAHVRDSGAPLHAAWRRRFQRLRKPGDVPCASARSARGTRNATTHPGKRRSFRRVLISKPVRPAPSLRARRCTECGVAYSLRAYILARVRTAPWRGTAHRQAARH